MHETTKQPFVRWLLNLFSYLLSAFKKSWRSRPSGILIGPSHKCPHCHAKANRVSGGFFQCPKCDGTWHSNKQLSGSGREA